MICLITIQLETDFKLYCWDVLIELCGTHPPRFLSNWASETDLYPPGEEPVAKENKMPGCVEEGVGAVLKPQLANPGNVDQLKFNS